MLTSSQRIAGRPPLAEDGSDAAVWRDRYRIRSNATGMTFDATLKDLGRDCPHGVLAEFDQPTTIRVSVLNADLSTVTKAADLVLGIGEPLKEVVHVEFQSSAAAWKHADLLRWRPELLGYQRT